MKQFYKRAAIVIVPILIIWFVIGPIVAFDLPRGHITLFDIINTVALMALLVIGMAGAAVLTLLLVGLSGITIIAIIKWIFTGAWVWGE